MATMLRELATSTLWRPHSTDSMMKWQFDWFFIWWHFTATASSTYRSFDVHLLLLHFILILPLLPMTTPMLRFDSKNSWATIFYCIFMPRSLIEICTSWTTYSVNKNTSDSELDWTGSQVRIETTWNESIRIPSQKRRKKNFVSHEIKRCVHVS